MDFIIRPLTPADADAALALLADCSAKGEVLYKPLEKADFLLRFFGENRWGFAAEAGGRLVGWAHAAAQTRFAASGCSLPTGRFACMTRLPLTSRSNTVSPINARVSGLSKSGSVFFSFSLIPIK